MIFFLKLLVLGLASIVLSLVLTPIVRWMMRKLNAVDIPSERRINKIPIPRGGGVAVVASFFIVTFGLIHFFPELIEKQPFLDILIPFTIGALVMSATGFWDDVKGVSAPIKLVVQIAVALFFCYSGTQFILPESIFGSFGHSPWVYVPLTVLWYVGIVNAFNLIDGLDGLSSGLSIIATIGLCGVVIFTNGERNILFVSVIFIGVLLGFLRYNYNPASIFLGDTGSLFLGTFLATIALRTYNQEALIVTIGVPLLCLGIPLMDTLLAIVRRTLRYFLNPVRNDKTSAVMTADCDHFHHRFLLWLGNNQRLAVWCLYGLASFLVAIGFLVVCVKEYKASIFLVGFMAFAYVVVRAMTNVEIWDAGRLLTRPSVSVGRRSVAVIIYAVLDLMIMVGLFCSLHMLPALNLPSEYLSTMTLLNIVLTFIVPVIVCLVLARCYTRIWERSTRKDSYQLVFAVLFGSFISQMGLNFARPELAHSLLTFHILWAFLLPLPLLFVRHGKTVFLQYLAGVENNRLRRQSLSNPTIERILFYGAGVNLRAYITFFEYNVTCNNVALVGILEDNLSMRGRVFRDLPIFGPLEELKSSRVFAKLRPTHLILTSAAIGVEREAEIRAFCSEHNVTVSRFTTTGGVLDTTCGLEPPPPPHTETYIHTLLTALRH
ncbi:MAG: hypothetical protein RR417_00160 [Kiritimatiellia bacterium]